ncbi:hypothetical protein KO494_09495 [Lacinutrix sp. C3R15]|uniref:hypothetical protein n=1 Tax=Flavobacteriaceae TaxID=49546 RepID=UPI001C07FDB5|nr:MULTISPECIES: hypothetical protein [Flavobacteriaceae]MBU2939771.1 hypothetical protein [Lacinutrix sp. C3R15]MDO6623086.1 hypothetical protein [Oceanihabitans sp. 1_MG-2023]
MEKNKNFTSLFFKNVGSLFYAIAAADKKVEKKEILVLKNSIKSQWQAVSFLDINALQEIILTFNRLHKENNQDPEVLYQDFVRYKNKEAHLFTSTITNLILQTANAIASSFSDKNKSELIMLAKLEIELKKA